MSISKVEVAVKKSCQEHKYDLSYARELKSEKKVKESIKTRRAIILTLKDPTRNPDKCFSLGILNLSEMEVSFRCDDFAVGFHHLQQVL